MKKFVCLVLFLMVFASAFFIACGSENDALPTEDNQPSYLYVDDYEDTDNSEEEALPSEALDIPDAVYFARIDLDAIDFNSMVIPTSSPHGEIGHWYVRHISAYLPSRVPFTYRELDAALWLEQMLLAKGFDESMVHVQTFSHYDVIGLEDYFDWGIPGLYDVKQQGWHDGHEARDYSQNIIVTIPGKSEQTIIIGAHYDSLRYEGTSDNASGVSLLMENAQRMLNQDNYYTLVYVFFGAHEIGMLGTFYFYESLTPEIRENIVLYINADVLIEGPDLIISTGYGFELNQNELSQQMKSFAELFYDTHEIMIRPLGVTGGDQLMFLYRGYTTLGLWGIDPSTFTNFLHSPRDSYEHISRRFPGMIERTMNAFALFLETILLEAF